MKNKKVEWLVKVAMLGAISGVLTILEFPLPFIAPTFYEMNFSDVPALIGGFALGPVAGILIEAIKIFIKLIFGGGTTTAFVGELSNFVLGVAFVLPASLIYKKNRTRNGALLGLIVGALCTVIAGCFTNAFIMIPLYSKFMPIEQIIGMASKIWPVINTMFEFVLYCVLPFNAIKAILVVFITLVIYKKLSPILKVKQQ